MPKSYSSNTIKSWAEDDRPREKLVSKGKGTLSNAELLAILIGMGSREHSAVDLGKIILASVGNDLNKLAKLTVSDMMKIKGIGQAKAVTIIAAMELARRKREYITTEQPKINSSRAAYEHFKPYLLDLLHEEFWIIGLNNRLEVVKTIQISSGGVTGTVVDPKIIFNHVLQNYCTGLILCHNHPSGNLEPSNADIKLTQKIKEAATVLDITLADHIIFSNNGYYSFADNGRLALM